MANFELESVRRAGELIKEIDGLILGNKKLPSDVIKSVPAEPVAMNLLKKPDEYVLKGPQQVKTNLL